MQHFYDGQIRRYVTQMVRLMSNFSVKDGSGTLKQVPVMYGDLTRQVANIIREEMDAIGGQEIKLTALQNKELWEKTDRWDDEKVDNWFKTELNNCTSSKLGVM